MATSEILRFQPFGLGNSERSYSAGRSSSALRAVERETVRSTLTSQYFWRILRLESLINEAKQLSQLRRDWDSYGAPPPNGKAIEMAVEFLISGSAPDLLPVRALPSAEGGIALRFVVEGKRALVEFLNSGSVEVMLYDEAGAIGPELEELADPANVLRAVQAHLTR